jgi:signal transduction histidine kinase/CheY-like chemotaxis protein
MSLISSPSRRTPATPTGAAAARRLLRRICVLLVVLGLVFAGAVAVALWHLRGDALATQTHNLTGLASALADELDRGLQSVLLVMQGVRDDVREGRLPADPDEAVAGLHRRAASLPLIHQLWIVDAQGRVAAASSPIEPPPLAGFAPPLAQLGEDGAAVSEPYVDLAAHETVVAVALPCRLGPGGEPGWVIAALPAGRLLGAFPAAKLAPDARLAVFRADGLRLAGSLAAANDIGAAPESMLALDERAVQRWRDGTPRHVQRRTTHTLGLQLVLTRDVAAGLARWRELAEATAAGGLVVVLVIGGLVAWLLRAEQARWHTQQALEQRLARSQRLDALGTLAGGVAHDFNNILGSLLGYAEMARDAATPGSAQHRQLGEVLHAVERGRAIVGRILTTSRGGARPAQRFEVQPLVVQVLSLIAGSAEGVRIERELASDPLHLHGDPDALFEAVMNLGTNALQAMPRGGVLRVVVQRAHVAAERWASHGWLAAGDYAAVTVADTGTGIAPEVIDRLFEPFFTTRGQAGTGLGLALVHGVAKAFGGDVDVDAAPGRGARFTLYLPLAAADADDAPLRMPEPAADDERPMGQGERIIVVDDEAALAALAEELLASLAYEPVCFVDPHKALRVFEADPAGYDLVVTDELMPGMAGTELAKRMKALRPELPVIVVSGWGGEQLARRARQAGATALLAKPLRVAELARAVAAALARSDQRQL